MLFNDFHTVLSVVQDENSNFNPCYLKQSTMLKYYKIL